MAVVAIAEQQSAFTAERAKARMVQVIAPRRGRFPPCGKLHEVASLGQKAAIAVGEKQVVIRGCGRRRRRQRRHGGGGQRLPQGAQLGFYGTKAVIERKAGRRMEQGILLGGKPTTIQQRNALTVAQGGGGKQLLCGRINRAFVFFKCDKR